MKSLITLLILTCLCLLPGCSEIIGEFENHAIMLVGDAPDTDLSCKGIAAATATYAIAHGWEYEMVYGIIQYSDGREVYHIHTRVFTDKYGWVWMRLSSNNTIFFTPGLWAEFKEMAVYDLNKFVYNLQRYWEGSD